MPDRVIAGELPVATSAAYFAPFPPGSVWFAVIERGSDATGKTVGIDMWCTILPTYVGYNIAGPGQDIPSGGPFVASFKPTAWSTPPSTDPGTGRQVPGKATIPDFVIAKPNFYHFEAQAGEVRVHGQAQVGKVGVEQMGHYWDEDAIRENTYTGRLEKMRKEIRDMARPRNTVGGAGTKPKSPQKRTTFR